MLRAHLHRCRHSPTHIRPWAQEFVTPLIYNLIGGEESEWTRRHGSRYVMRPLAPSVQHSTAHLLHTLILSRTHTVLSHTHTVHMLSVACLPCLSFVLSRTTVHTLTHDHIAGFSRFRSCVGPLLEALVSRPASTFESCEGPRCRRLAVDSGRSGRVLVLCHETASRNTLLCPWPPTMHGTRLTPSLAPRACTLQAADGTARCKQRTAAFRCKQPTAAFRCKQPPAPPAASSRRQHSAVSSRRHSAVSSRRAVSKKQVSAPGPKAL